MTSPKKIPLMRWLSDRKIDLFWASIAVVGAMVPIAGSVYWADRQAVSAESERMAVYTKQLSDRSKATKEEVRRVIAELEHNQNGDPCSESQIALMEELDVTSPHLQKIGYLENDRFVCSSYGRNRDGWRVTSSERTTLPLGIELTTGVKIDRLPGMTFVMVQRNGYAVILHEDLLVDIPTEPKDVVLAIYSIGTSGFVASHGQVDGAWVAHAREHTQTFFVEDPYFIAVVMGDLKDGVAVAALPLEFLELKKTKMRRVLVPFGVVGGLGVAIAVLLFQRRRRSMAAMLRVAIKNNEFFLNYQPLIDLRTGTCVGAEALIRWRQRDGTMIRPDIFIPVAEEAGLITQITERVMAICEREAPAVLKKHLGLHIAINLSSDDILSTRTPKLLAQLATRTGTLVDNWMVEATERGFMNSQDCRDTIHTIRAMHMPVAIDDFGTGYSSLAYLGSFELDYLKIDKSFVDAIGTDAATNHVAFHIIEMAKSLGLKMIAEGVETQAQAEVLRSRGVQFAQGWLFGKPMSIDELDAFVTKRNATPSG